MQPRMAIGIAAALVFIIESWVPMGHQILYPLTLFTTWVHEMGHGLTALVMGGQFTELVIRGDASGYAMAGASSGWPDALVSAGGLLAPPILGSIILATVHGPRRARILLSFLAVALVASIAVYVRSAVGVIAMSAVAALLGYVALIGFRKNPHRRVIVAQVLGVMLALDTVFRMVGYALSSEARKGEASDAQHIATNLGGSYWMWGLAIIVIPIALLAFSLWWAWRRPAPSPAVDRSPSPAARANRAFR
jgi:hypothetical protein